MYARSAHYDHTDAKYGLESTGALNDPAFQYIKNKVRLGEN